EAGGPHEDPSRDPRQGTHGGAEGARNEPGSGRRGTGQGGGPEAWGEARRTAGPEGRREGRPGPGEGGGRGEGRGGGGAERGGVAVGPSRLSVFGERRARGGSLTRPETAHARWC